MDTRNAVAAVVIFFICFYLVTGSIKKLQSKPSPFYPFDLLIPKAKHWSVIVFIIINIIFFLIFYIGARMDISLLPA